MKQLYLWGCAALMLASCTRSEIGNEPQGGSGPVSRVAFTASVQPQYTVNYPSAESSGVDLDQVQWPAATDFSLDILSGGSAVQSFPAGNIPSQLELYVGAYTLLAHSGTPTEAWNAPYLSGTQDFALSSTSTSVNAQLTCGLQSTLVYLVFDKNFSTVFSDYTAYLNTEHTKEAWVWTAGEKRVACMRPTEQLLIRVDVTMRSNGTKYDYGINPLVDLKAGELNVVRFSMVGGEVTATISSDNGVKVTEKTVALQADWLATRKTSISATFDPATALENIYGMPYTTPTDVVVRSNVGLKSLKLKASGTLATLLGVTEVDLLATNEVQTKTGLQFDKVITPVTGTTQVALFDGRLNFKGCFNTLPVLEGASSEYVFTVEAVDLLGDTKTFDTKINMLLPELGTRSVDAAKVWNRYAQVPGVAVIDARVPAEYREKFGFAYAIREGDGKWQSLGKHTGSGDLYKNGLKPGTTYTTAVDLGGGRYVAEASFTTDIEPQIPNGNFEQSALPPQANGNIGAYYEPTSWATLNALTTQNYSTSAKASQAYPCVKIESGAAVLVTRGWGANSKINHDKSFLGAHNWYVKSLDQVTAGKLFLGSYVYGAADPEVKGLLPLTVKPKAINFRYKYESKGGSAWLVECRIMSGSTLMGQVRYTANLNVGQWITQMLPIEYSLVDFDLEPTSIELFFLGEIAPTTGNLSIEGVDKPGYWKAPKETSQSYYEGAKLTIDDVELLYLQDINDQYTIK